jgi:DNA-binding NarL/FixJ family response regulator
MSKRNTKHTTPVAEQPATTAPAAPDLTAMLAQIQDPALKAKLQAELAGQLAFAAAQEAAAKAHEQRGEALKAKLESVLTEVDLAGDTFNLFVSGATGKVTVEVWPDAKPAPSRGTTWTDARKQELADLLRDGLSKAEAAERMGVSVSSVGNVIYTCGRNLQGFLARHPEQDGE